VREKVTVVNGWC